MRALLRIHLLGLALLIASCNHAPSDARALLQANPPTSQPTTGEIVIKGTHSLMSLSLAHLPSCERRVHGTITWHAPKEIASVQIWVTDSAGSKLFADGSNSGAARTGNWIAPDTTFIMRARTSTIELDRLTVSKHTC